MPDAKHSETDRLAYDVMIEYAESGMVPACIVVSHNGAQHVWSQGAEFDQTKLNDDLDSLALAIIAINRAWKTANANGFTPVL